MSDTARMVQCFYRFVRASAAAIVAVAACANVAPAQTTVSFPVPTVASGNANYVLGISSVNAAADYTGSASIRIGPGDQVAILDIQINAVATWNAVVPYPGGGAPARIISFAFRHAAPGSGLSVPATRDAQGNLTFSNIAVSGFLIGTASHTSTPIVCTQIAAAGAPCNGSFDLSAAGVRSLQVSGFVPASASGTASLTVSGFAPFNINSPSWGYVNALAFWSGPVIGGSTCVADFNGVGGVSVQDIFDFLTAWFAGDPRADVSGGGVGAQDIFDFLGVWFAGC